MGIFEAQEVDGKEDFLEPEPPPVGSLGYRRVILNICAAWVDEYDAAIRPVFQWRGWKCAVEVMCEVIGAVSATCPAHLVDAFGNVKLDSLVAVMDDDEILREAHAVAPKMHPDLPRHEALALSINEGEEVRALLLDLLPVWNQAATILRKAETTAAMEPARALFTRWLNKYDDRVQVAAVAASMTHTYWRWRALPPGDAWVEGMLKGGADVSGSIAWARDATLMDVRRQQPDLVDNWVTRMAPEPGQKKRRKKKGGCCPNCGKQR